MEQKDIGLLLREKNIKLQRHYFNETVKLIGIQCIYRAPIENKTWDGWGELNAYYQPPQIVGCLFFEKTKKKTLKKKGWVAELQENSSIIHVPYDLINIQKGCLFEIPGGLDNTKPRLFRVLNISNIMIYPASLSCEIAPEYLDIDEQSIHTDFKNKNISLLIDNEEDD